MLESEKSKVTPEVMAALPEPLRKFLADGKSEIHGDDGDWMVLVVQDVPKYCRKDLPEGSVIIANNGCGDHLFLTRRAGETIKFSPEVHVHWHEGPQVELYARDIEMLVNPPPPAASNTGPVFYHDGKTPVQPGDEVTARNFFFRKPGRVVYVPGISKKNREMERHGLCWVAIKFSGGSRTGTVVDPKTRCLKKSVHFVKRADDAVEEMGPDERFE